MAFKVTNPNPCLNNCECSVSSPSKPCVHNDGCLSLCSISAVTTDPVQPSSIDILDDMFPHNLSACDGVTPVLTIEDYDTDFFQSVSLTGSVLEWVTKDSGFSDITIKSQCGNFSSYMCVTVKSVILPNKSILQIKDAPTIVTPPEPTCQEDTYRLLVSNSDTENRVRFFSNPDDSSISAEWTCSVQKSDCDGVVISTEVVETDMRPLLSPVIGYSIALGDGDYPQSIDVVDSTTMSVTTIDTSQASPYLAGNPSDLIFDSSNPTVFNDALRGLLENALSQIFGATKGINYDWSEFNTSATSINLFFETHHTPTNQWIGLDNSFTGSSMFTIFDASANINTPLEATYKASGGDWFCAYDTPCGSVYSEIDIAFDPILFDFNQVSSFNTGIVNNPTYITPPSTGDDNRNCPKQ